MIMDLIKAWKLGGEVGSPANWKVGQLSFTALSGLVYLIFKNFLPDFELTPDIADTITNWLFYGLVLVNIIVTKVSSKKI